MRPFFSLLVLLVATAYFGVSLHAGDPPTDPVPNAKGSYPTLKERKDTPSVNDRRENGAGSPSKEGKTAVEVRDLGTGLSSTSGEYVLGAQDVLVIQSMHLEELKDRIVPVGLPQDFPQQVFTHVQDSFLAVSATTP